MQENKFKRLKEIADSIGWMRDNLSGCDWCCGGGDKKMADLRDEQSKLLAELPPIQMTQARIDSINSGGGEFWAYFIYYFEDIDIGTEAIVVHVHGSGEAFEVEVGPFDKQGIPSNGVRLVPSEKLREGPKYNG